MPDAATLPVKARVMPREEANFLAASQREFLRRQAEETAMYRANPLLYVYNPKVKVGEWRGGEGRLGLMPGLQTVGAGLSDLGFLFHLWV